MHNLIKYAKRATIAVVLTVGTVWTLAGWMYEAKH